MLASAIAPPCAQPAAPLAPCPLTTLAPETPQRSTLEQLPPEDVLARAQRSRLLTAAEEEKRLLDLDKKRRAQEVEVR